MFPTLSCVYPVAVEHEFARRSHRLKPITPNPNGATEGSTSAGDRRGHQTILPYCIYERHDYVGAPPRDSSDPRPLGRLAVPRSRRSSLVKDDRGSRLASGKVAGVAGRPAFNMVRYASGTTSTEALTVA